MQVTATGRVAAGSTWQADDMDAGWTAWTLIWDDEGSFHRLKTTNRDHWPLLEQARPAGILRATGIPDKVYYWMINVTELEVVDEEMPAVQSHSRPGSDMHGDGGVGLDH